MMPLLLPSLQVVRKEGERKKQVKAGSQAYYTFTL
jgi:hypothetical protein